ncbi:MAG: PcfJ domain-containing protein [SAR324 cluster bacterium]|nr:PcfJ domain-containing protein [SAR324 cluster bacterium]
MVNEELRNHGWAWRLDSDRLHGSLAALNVKIKILNWGQGLEWYAEEDEGLPSSSDLGLNLLDWECLQDSNDALAVRQFLKAIPFLVRKACRPYVSYQFTMLQVVAQYPAAKDLMNTNPNLLWLICFWGRESGRTLDQIGELLRYRKRDLLSMILNPITPLAVRLVQRIQAEAFTFVEYQVILEFLRSTDILIHFAHVRTLPIPLLELTNQHPTFSEWIIRVFLRHKEESAQVRFLGEVWEAVDTLYDLSRLAKHLRIDLGLSLRRINRVGGLIFLKDRWRHQFGLLLADIDNYDNGEMPPLSERISNWLLRPKLTVLRKLDKFGINLERVALGIKDGCKFPKPPIEGTQDIRPLCSSYQMLQEGREMNHCVASYRDRILSGASYIYAIHQPERGTIEIDAYSPLPHLLQAKGVNNRNLAQNTLKAVEDWLLQSQGIGS